MKNRLLLFLNNENISATILADEIGVQRSSISHILSGRNNPSFDFIYKIIKKYDNLNAEWLITGRGEMYKSEEKLSKKASGPDMNLFTDQNNVNAARPEHEKTGIRRSLTPTENDQDNEYSNKVTNVNKIEKIVYFYKNGTFKEYHPSE